MSEDGAEQRHRAFDRGGEIDGAWLGLDRAASRAIDMEAGGGMACSSEIL
jgi:hypothetical protein